MGYIANANTNTRKTNTNFKKADAFLNVGVTGKSGNSHKLGAITLHNDRDVEHFVINVSRNEKSFKTLVDNMLFEVNFTGKRDLAKDFANLLKGVDYKPLTVVEQQGNFEKATAFINISIQGVTEDDVVKIGAVPLYQSKELHASILNRLESGDTETLKAFVACLTFDFHEVQDRDFSADLAF